MPNSLSLSDGTTTISLSSSGCMLTRYVPTGPDLDASGSYRPVTETVEFFISDSSAANVQAKVASVERLLQDAVRAQSGLCAKVYLLFQTGADAAAWRSEILSSRLLLGEDASVNLYQYRMDCRLIVTRLHYWEGAEVELQLSTSNQAAATGGRIIYNHDDSALEHDNWVQIAAAQVAGSVPAGVRIEITNIVGATRTWRKLFIALNALSDPANFAHILEAENRLAGGTVTADANASNGNKVNFTLSASSVTLTWTLTAAMLQDTAGRMFRILASVLNASGATIEGTAQTAVQNTAGTNLWKGDVVPMADAPGLLDLGAIPLPPGGYSAAYGELRLALTITGTGTWGIDYLQLTPTDGLSLLSCIYAVPYMEAVMSDSIEGRNYVLVGSAQLPYVISSGGEIYLHPNRLQRLIFLADSTEVYARPADMFIIRAWYRPRRLTV